MHRLRHRAGNHDSDRLTVVQDLGVLQDSDVALGLHLQRIEGSHHGDDSGGVRSRGGIDGRDRTCGNRALHKIAIRRVLDWKLRCILRRARDLQASVVAMIELRGLRSVGMRWNLWRGWLSCGCKF